MSLVVFSCLSFTAIVLEMVVLGVCIGILFLTVAPLGCKKPFDPIVVVICYHVVYGP